MYVYVIMPVGSDPKYSNKRDIIKKVAKEVNIDVYIPSGVNNPLDMDFTIEKLKNAKSVIADLSFERPSCYYELGIAQAFGKRVFLLAEEGTRIHQSKNREPTVYFANLKDYKRILSKALKKAHTHSRTV